jgi:SRSO17 transposase
MRKSEVAALRGQLDAYGHDIFASFARRDQRAKGSLYVQGLLLDGQRKSIQPMAQRLGVDHQQLQQFTASSTWEVAPVRRRMAALATEVIDPEVWVVDDTGFPKDGPASPGVARQYSGTLGKINNCQIAVSLNMATDAASSPMNWRLYLPKAWDDTYTDTEQQAHQVQHRRTKAGIPDTVRHQPKWHQALEMIDQACDWELTSLPVVADAGYGDITAFRQGLTDRGVDYVVAVSHTISAYANDEQPETMGNATGRPSVPKYRAKPRSVKDLAVAAGRKHLRQVTWRHGTKASPTNPTGAMRSRFLALRIRPANRDIPRNLDGSLPQVWLIAQWPPHHPAPTDYWLSTMPADTPLKTLVRYAKMRWRIEHDYRELKYGLGLDHFEGRSYHGFHRHLTLVTAAQLFITKLRIADPKAHGAP